MQLQLLQKGLKMQTNYLRDEARNIERNFAQYDIDTSKLSIDLVLCTPEFFHGKKLEATLFLSPVDIPYFDLSVLPNSEKMIKTSMFAEGGHVEATYTREGKYGNSIYMLRTLPKKLQSLVLAHSIAHVFQNNHNPDLMKISTEIYNINQNMYYELVSFIENESIKYSQRRKDFIAFNNLLGLTDGLDKMPFFDFFKNQFPKGMSVENIINLSIQKKS